MISRCLPLMLFSIAFVPRPLQAQTPLSSQRTASLQFEARDINFDKMYEDIEIFRRILGRELQPLYPRVSSSNVIGNPFTSTARAYPTDGNFYLFEPYTAYILASGPNKEEIFPSLEGVYLKGQGIVYTATLSSLQLAAKSVSHSSVSRVLSLAVVQQESEWENIRRQVRNEKKKPKNLEASKPPSLSDALLSVLAENGHNFSQLGENESLIVVLTAHEPSPSSAAPQSGTGSAKAAGFKQASSNKIADLRSQPRDLELLGELHLKQGRSEEAIAVFHGLLKQTTNPKQQAEVRRKLAQAYLMQGQDEKARAELDQAIALLKKDAEAKDKPLPTTKPAAALPVKLIVSAPKKLLNQVKDGKITFEEFRRQAHVETLRFDERR